MPKLTRRTVEATKSGPARDVFTWDDELSGFGVRVLPSGKRSYLVQYRFARRTRRLTLGAHGVLTAQQARRLARAALGDLARGIDPAAARRAKAKAPTVKELGQRYLREHAKPKKRPSSAASDESLLKRCIYPRLGQRLVIDLCREQLHRRVGKDTPTQANRVLALVSKMMNLAERWGLRSDGTNPCRHVERFRETKRERFLSSAEIAKIGDALAALEREGKITGAAAAAVRVLLLTGARRGEVLRAPLGLDRLGARLSAAPRFEDRGQADPPLRAGLAGALRPPSSQRVGLPDRARRLARGPLAAVGHDPRGGEAP